MVIVAAVGNKTAAMLLPFQHANPSPWSQISDFRGPLRPSSCFTVRRIDSTIGMAALNCCLMPPGQSSMSVAPINGKSSSTCFQCPVKRVYRITLGPFFHLLSFDSSFVSYLYCHWGLLCLLGSTCWKRRSLGFRGLIRSFTANSEQSTPWSAMQSRWVGKSLRLPYSQGHSCFFSWALPTPASHSLRSSQLVVPPDSMLTELYLSSVTL